MKNKKILNAILCAIGSGMIGYFASYLDTIYGNILFISGIILLIFSIIKISKD